MKSFADRLIEVLGERDSPVAVGLDPQLKWLPQEIKDMAFRRHGKGLKGASQAILEFNQRIIDTISPYVGVVKLQIAFYEALGHWGLDAYSKTIGYAQKKGLMVIGDIKRGDVEHTAEAYAQAHLGEMEIDGSFVYPYSVDAVTLNPYLGGDSVAPFLKRAERYGKGLFILVKSTNPSSRDFQDLRCGGERLCERVARKVNQWGMALVGKHGYSAVGAVVGANSPSLAKRLRLLMPRAFFLVPGYGAQGAGPEGLYPYFNRDGSGAIISSSRAIIFAYRNPPWRRRYGMRNWEAAVREALLRMRSEVAEVVGRIRRRGGKLF